MKLRGVTGMLEKIVKKQNMHLPCITALSEKCMKSTSGIQPLPEEKSKNSESDGGLTAELLLI